MTYTPRPIDTSRIDLPADLQALAERLARNVHEAWAHQHLKEGWVSGPATDIANRVHAMLVPYEQLTRSEQDYDRIAVEQTLKPLLAIGYRILPPARGTAAAAALEALGTVPVPAGASSDAETASRFFDLCEAETAAQYHQADQAAIRQQQYHRRVAATAAICGTVAALFALLQLAEPLRGSWQTVLESLFAGAAVLSVVLGVVGSRKARWLLERHKAEQLATLRFRALGAMIEGCTHVADDDGLRAVVRQQTQHIADVGESDVRSPKPAALPFALARAGSPTDLHATPPQAANGLFRSTGTTRPAHRAMVLSGGPRRVLRKRGLCLCPFHLRAAPRRTR
ncbi:MAG: hypothetical protein LLG01_09320 [Planctomycetaceae bacterium]|nr:hypothetical protein [Planctomycetaceae bacterium]